jgi:acetolactate synthase I/III small subunit
VTMDVKKRHTLVSLMEDRPGVLNRVLSLFRRRSFNIESLTVGPTHIPSLSRMTLSVEATDTVVEQVIKQLYKIVDIVKVVDVTDQPKVLRELALIKVNATASTRAEIMQIASIYRASVVDVTRESVMIQVTGQADKIDSFISLLRGFGIREMCRTGNVAMVRAGTRLTGSEEGLIGVEDRKNVEMESLGHKSSRKPRAPQIIPDEEQGGYGDL